MIVREVEGVDRIRVAGCRRRVRVQERRRVGPRRPDGGTVSVQGVAGDAAGGRRPGEGDSGGGHAAGLEAGGGGGSRGRGGGRATPEYSATDPCRYAVEETDTVIVIPLGAAWLFSR